MAFINEEVSEADAINYDFAKLSRLFHKDEWQLKSWWTIDRDRNIFLICLGTGREEFCMQHRFLFWWDGVVLDIRLDGTKEGNPFGKIISRWDSLSLGIPTDFPSTRDDLIGTLKEALTVFKWHGYDNQDVEHTAIFNF